MLHDIQRLRFAAAGSSPVLFIVVSLCLVRPMPVMAQNAATTEERLKAVERERDELKKRNGVLELRLKQLQATVNKEVTEALQPAREELTAAPPTPHPPPESPAGSVPATPAATSIGIPYWRATAAVYPRFAGIPPALQSPVDVIGLAVAYQDALGEFQKTRRPKESKEGRSIGDVDPAERKVRLLRSITMTLRDQAAAEVDRVRKLAAVHAVPVVDLRNLDAKMKILDLILAQDPDAGPMPAQSASEKPTKPVKTE
jgi:hypothetical protein